MRDRRRGDAKMHFRGAGIAHHLHDLGRRGAAHDGIVDQQNILAAEFQIDRVEFLAHRLLAFLLPGHDEGAADVAIFDEAFAVF